MGWDLGTWQSTNTRSMSYMGQAIWDTFLDYRNTRNSSPDARRPKECLHLEAFDGDAGSGAAARGDVEGDALRVVGPE